MSKEKSKTEKRLNEITLQRERSLAEIQPQPAQPSLTVFGLARSLAIFFCNLNRKTRARESLEGERNQLELDGALHSCSIANESPNRN